MATQVIATGQGEPKLLLGPVLQAAIERAIATVPPDKRGKVELRITLEGVEAEAAMRLFAGADASVFWQLRKTGDQAFGARVRWTF